MIKSGHKICNFIEEFLFIIKFKVKGAIMEILNEIVNFVFGSIIKKVKKFFNESSTYNELEESLACLFTRYMQQNKYFKNLSDIRETGAIDDYIEYVFNENGNDDINEFMNREYFKSYSKSQLEVIRKFFIDFRSEILLSIINKLDSKSRFVANSFNSQLKNISNEKKNNHSYELNSKVLPISNELIDRPILVSEINELLIEHKYVALYGIAGIGKSELAKMYAQTAKKMKYYDIIQWVAYEQCLLNTIASLSIKGKMYDINISQDDYFYDVIKILQDSKKKILLIIDNVDMQKEEFEFYQSLLSIENCYVLITTKKIPLPYFKIFEVPTLNETDFINLYELINKQKCSDKSKYLIKQIAIKIDYHTMYLLIAFKQVYAGKRTLKEIYNELQRNHFNEENVSLIKDKEYKERRAIEWIASLFDIDLLNLNYQIILMNAYFLPIEGMNKDRFLKLTGNSLDDIIYLTNNGYIQLSGDFVSMHPIMNALVKSTLADKFLSCEDFLRNTYRYYRYRSGDILYLMAIIRKLDIIFNSTTYEMVGFLAERLLQFGDYDTNFIYRKMQYEYAQNIKESNITIWFDAINNYGLAHKLLTHYDEANDLYCECSLLKSKLPKSKKCKILEIQFDINYGAYYIEMGNHELARDYLESAFKEVSTNLKKYSYFLIMETYRNFAKCLTRNPAATIKDKEYAVKLLKEALNISYKNKNSPRYIAEHLVTKNNLAKRYVEDFKDFEAAEKIYNESLSSLEQIDTKFLYGIICLNAAICKHEQYKISPSKENESKLIDLLNKSLSTLNKESRNYLDAKIIASEIYFTLGDSVKARRHAKDAQNLIQILKERVKRFDWRSREKHIDQLLNRS